MIDSHPSLSKKTAPKSHDFDPLDGAFRVAGSFSRDNEYANPAQKRRFIKPNKTGDPKQPELSVAIGKLPRSSITVALLKCRESCFSATTKTRSKMCVLGPLILLVFAVLVGVLLAARN